MSERERKRETETETAVSITGGFLVPDRRHWEKLPAVKIHRISLYSCFFVIIFKSVSVTYN